MAQLEEHLTQSSQAVTAPPVATVPQTAVREESVQKQGEDWFQGFLPTAIGPVLVAFLSLAGPLYPIGLFITEHNLHRTYGFDSETAWYAAGLLPKDAVVMDAIRYIFSVSALQFFLIVVICTGIGLAAYKILFWIRSAPSEGGSRSDAWCRRLERVAQRLSAVGRRHGTLPDLAASNFSEKPSYSLWYVIFAHIVVVLGFVYMLFVITVGISVWVSYSDPSATLFIVFLYAVPLIAAVALLLHLHNWLDFNHELPEFSSHVALAVVLLALLGLVAMGGIGAVNNHAPIYPLLVGVALGDGLIFLSMLGGLFKIDGIASSPRSLHARRGGTVLPLLLVLHTFPVVYSTYVMIAQEGLTGYTHDYAQFDTSLSPYLTGFGAGVAFYLFLRIFLLHEPFWKWITPAILCAYAAALVPVYAGTGVNQNMCRPVGPGVTISSSGSSPVRGDWIGENGGYVYVVTGGPLHTSGVLFPQGYSIVAFPSKDAEYVFGVPSLAAGSCQSTSQGS